MVSVGKEPFQTGSWAEQAWGFAQAVKVGDTIYVSGQTAFMDDGSIDGIGDIGRDRDRVPTVRLRFGGDHFGRVRFDVGDHQLHAGLGQREHQRPADAAAATRHHRGPPFEVSHGREP